MKADLADRLLRYEMEDMGEDETLDLFADLVASGWIPHLQGHYGRMASALIQGGWISPEGRVLHRLGRGDDY